METNVNEVADGIYRLSTFMPEVTPEGFTFNQYLVDAEEPLMFHLGHRMLFDSVSKAVGTVLPVERIRWLTFGHVEADESGSMNQWLAAAPKSEVAQGVIGVMVSIMDLADRPPRSLGGGEVLDLGGKRVRWIDTSHVPHGWEAGILYEETTGTLFCGDLFTRTGPTDALSEGDPVGPAAAAEDMFQATCLTPETGPTIRGLADLQPERLALMHGAVYTGDCTAALRALADDYDARLEKAAAG
jgi:flavorubredoxin